MEALKQNFLDPVRRFSKRQVSYFTLLYFTLLYFYSILFQKTIPKLQSNKINQIKIFEEMR